MLDDICLEIQMDRVEVRFKENLIAIMYAWADGEVCSNDELKYDWKV